jgi:transposase-like protein
MQKRRQYSGEQKTKILRELLENNVPISQLCEQYKVRPNGHIQLEEKTVRICTKHIWFSVQKK